MNPLMKHVHQLSVVIGPRQTTSEQERAAANYIVKRLTGFGLHPERVRFTTVSSFSFPQIALIGATLLAVPISFYVPPVGALVALVAVCLYILDVETHFSLSFLFRRHESENISVTTGSDTPREKVVITAHYDSSRSGPNFHPDLVKGFRRSFLALLVCMILIAVLAIIRGIQVLAGAAQPLSGWVMVLPAIYLAIVIGGLILREATGEVTPGANDNASGVAVLLGLARELSVKPPEHVQVELVFTGAEEAGTFGMLHYLGVNDHSDKLFINLDNLGSGRLFVTTAEGAIRKHLADPGLLAMAQEATYTAPTLPIDFAPYRLLTTDATPVMARKGRAISIMARDKDGLLPNWHWKTDTIDHVDVANLNRAKTLVLRMLRRLDTR